VRLKYNKLVPLRVALHLSAHAQQKGLTESEEAEGAPFEEVDVQAVPVLAVLLVSENVHVHLEEVLAHEFLDHFLVVYESVRVDFRADLQLALLPYELPLLRERVRDIKITYLRFFRTAQTQRSMSSGFPVN